MGLRVQKPAVAKAVEDHLFRYGESARDRVDVGELIVLLLLPHGPQDGSREQCLSGYSVAPRLLTTPAIRARVLIGQRAVPQDEVREFEDQCEVLSGFSIVVVGEDQWCDRVRERETVELVNGQGAPGLIPHNTIDHDHDTECLNALDQCAPEVGGSAPGMIGVSAEEPGEVRGDAGRVAVQGSGTDEFKRSGALVDGELAVPVLTALAQVDRVQQVAGGFVHAGSAVCAHIRYGEHFTGRLLQEQHSGRHVGRVRERLELLGGRLALTREPTVFVRGNVLVDSCARQRPA